MVFLNLVLILSQSSKSVLQQDGVGGVGAGYLRDTNLALRITSISHIQIFVIALFHSITGHHTITTFEVQRTCAVHTPDGVDRVVWIYDKFFREYVFAHEVCLDCALHAAPVDWLSVAL